MTRMLMIGLRVLDPARDTEVVGLVGQAVSLARMRRLVTELPHHILRTEAGFLLIVAELTSVRAVDAMDEDPDIQDVISQVSALAEPVPLHGLVEFNATRVTFEALTH